MAARASSARPRMCYAFSSRFRTTNFSDPPVSSGFLYGRGISDTPRSLEAVMDIVGHYELPACHINPETATLEDCDYAIDLGRFCIAYYDRFCESLNELIRDKLDTNAGGSVAV